MFSLELPQRGNSNEYTQYTISHNEKENHPKLSQMQLWDLFQATQEQVQNSCGKQAIIVRAIEVLLYFF